MLRKKDCQITINSSWPEILENKAVQHILTEAIKKKKVSPASKTVEELEEYLEAQRSITVENIANLIQEYYPEILEIAEKTLKIIAKGYNGVLPNYDTIQSLLYKADLFHKNSIPRTKEEITKRTVEILSSKGTETHPHLTASGNIFNYTLIENEGELLVRVNDTLFLATSDKKPHLFQGKYLIKKYTDKRYY